MFTGVGARTAFIQPDSPSENGHVESFKGKLWNGLLNAEVFDTLAEAKVMTEEWRRRYNTVHPHSSLHDRPPASGVFLPLRRPSPAGHSPGSSGHVPSMQHEKSDLISS